MPRRRKYTSRPDGTASMHNKAFYLTVRNENIATAIEYLQESGYASQGQAIAMLEPKGIR